MKLPHRMKNPMGPRCTTIISREKIAHSSDDFGLRGPVIQKPFQTKSATSIVARVLTYSQAKHVHAWCLEK